MKHYLFIIVFMIMLLSFTPVLKFFSSCFPFINRFITTNSTQNSSIMPMATKYYGVNPSSPGKSTVKSPLLLKFNAPDGNLLNSGNHAKSFPDLEIRQGYQEIIYKSVKGSPLH